MKESKIIFHCGLPKTGTSSIQSFISANQSHLAGILSYPGNNSPAGNADWMVPLIINNRVQRIRALATEAQQTAPLVLFSSENLYHAMRFSPNAFIQLVNDLNATVILYFPTIRGFLLSSLNQLIRNHCHATTEVDDRLMQMCDYTQLLIRLKQDIAPGNLLCFPYDRTTFPEGNILLHFLHTLAIESKDILDHARLFKDQNVSLSPLALGFLLEMAQGGMTLQTPEQQIQLRQIVQAYADKQSEQDRITQLTIGPRYQEVIIQQEHLFSRAFPASIISDFTLPNPGICTPVNEKYWDGLTQEADTNNKPLSKKIQQLRADSQQYQQYCEAVKGRERDHGMGKKRIPPIRFSITTNDLCKNRNLMRLWQTERSLVLSDDIKISLPESMSPIIIDLPQLFPIPRLYLSVKMVFSCQPKYMPWLYWTTINTGTLTKKNSSPMLAMSATVYAANVSDPMYNGSLSIWIEKCLESICIDSIEISFSSEELLAPDSFATV
jgi:hypothetical protein